jgi:DNA-binding beta-propeller fold protein YncE
MGMRKLSLLGALALCLCITNVASAGGPPAPFGSVLTSFTPAAVGNGRALAVNPKTGLLYYTNAGDTNIYVTDAAGTAIATLATSPAHNYGALSWDSKRGVLWGGRYDGSGAVDQIDPTIGADTFQFAYAFPPGDSCYLSPPGFTDGLAYDRVTDTLWLSDDNAKTIFHVTLTGATISSSPVPAGRCNTGIASAGQFLWLALQSGPDTPPFDLVHVAKSDPSTVLSDIPFVSGGAGPEGIAVDRKSFVPNCTVWTNQYGPTKLTAWADEPGCPSD